MRINPTFLDIELLNWLYYDEYTFTDCIQNTLETNKDKLLVPELLEVFDTFEADDHKRLEFYWRKKQFDLETSINMTQFDKVFPDEEDEHGELSYMENSYREWRKDQ